MEALVQLRGVIKGRLTRAHTFVKSIDKDSISVNELDARLEKLEEYWTQFQNVQNDIDSLCVVDTEMEIQDDEKVEFENRYFTIRAELKDTIDSMRKDTANPVVMATEPLQVSGTVQSSHGAQIKLPRLELPSFNGNVLDWQSFANQFLDIIHSDNQLSNVQKLQYLKSCVKADAARLIQSLEISAENYEQAWGLLVRRFEDKNTIIQTHLKRFIQQPVVGRESPHGLQKMLDTSFESLRALKSLGVPTEHWDYIVMYHICEKLDDQSRREWEISSRSMSEEPLLSDLMDFLEARCRGLIAAQLSKPKPQMATSSTSKPYGNSFHNRNHTMTFHATSGYTCPICRTDHAIFKCVKFLNMNVVKRKMFARNRQLCYNCLKHGHYLGDCKSGPCRTCHKRHHTLLHDQPTSTAVNAKLDTVSINFASNRNKPSQVLLSTAIAIIESVNGNDSKVRVLLDSGSQASFISSQCARRLGLPRQPGILKINSVGGSKAASTLGFVRCTIKSPFNSKFKMNMQAHVLTRLTSELPNFVVNASKWNHVEGLSLADPDFHKPGEIDMLLGANILPHLFPNHITGPLGAPVAQETVFGWVLSGDVFQPKENKQILSYHTTCDVNEQLKRFWEIEEISAQSTMSVEEKSCEQNYASTHYRTSSGRFVVRLPFTDSDGNIVANKLGYSREAAVNRFLQVEKRLIRYPERKDEYIKFMREYQSLGHMELLTVAVYNNTCAYYMPHHAVLKEASSSTKLRVVFDASAKSSNGVSLNDLLLAGPRLQEDLFQILLRFRTYPIAFTADIEKMYRQILMNRDDVNYQRIVWRESPDHELKDYALLTVTYGITSAPYLAVKSLQELARAESETFPIAASVVLNDFYVDDVLTGGETVQEVLQLKQALTELLSRGGFTLRKYSSNEAELLQSVAAEDRETQLPLDLQSDESTKTLGLHWHPATDKLSFTVTTTKSNVVTKRTILSNVARIFDPLGLLSPAIVKVKILLQKLWTMGLSWDEQVPTSVQQEWEEFQAQLPLMEQIKINRYFDGCLKKNKLELHGFCDSSESAFAAAVYIRVIESDNNESVESNFINLVCSKTKVAPLKKLTLPRLELCGAHLLVKLLKTVKYSLKVKFSGTFAWTDSTIVLGWINSPPNRWKTFVANRVAQIQEIVPPEHWYHVSSESNPADCASRGIKASALRTNDLWWHGPTWLQEFKSSSHINLRFSDNLEERKSCQVLVATESTDLTWIESFSSLTRLKRVIAHCFRFAENCKKSQYFGFLTTAELQKSLIHLVKTTQTSTFREEIKLLSQHKEIAKTSRLYSLHPFLDPLGVLRVGGRLQNSTLSYSERHPIVLSKKDHLAKLLVDYEHRSLLHAGPTLLLSTIQSKFWILGARDLVRQHVHRCITCFRLKAAAAQQLMGVLRPARVQPNRPFTNTGVDYAGPIEIKTWKGRGAKVHKAYIAIFVCLSVKAIHLELVSELSTSAFMATLKRFVSRRGRPANIFSDNGTNFIGAKNEVEEVSRQLRSKELNEGVSKMLSDDGISWSLIPPSAPHFGGLWEAGVKSTKLHLRRVVGNEVLTFEEMTTVLTQVEACLNSRPLSPLSADPSDYSPLTPGHFLIGAPLTAVPELDLSEVPNNRLCRWQLVQRMVQCFWKRWSSEYLSRLQQRPKWCGGKPNLGIGDLVIVKDANHSPLRWKLARVTKTHPGPDGFVRVVTIQTTDGLLKRPIHKLCPLPIDNVQAAENVTNVGTASQC